MLHSFFSTYIIPFVINILCAFIYDAYKKHSSENNPDDAGAKYTLRYVLICRLQAVLGLVIGVIFLVLAFNIPQVAVLLNTLSFFSFFLSFCGSECLAEVAKHFLDKSDATTNDEEK